jgi:hypothetical protein
MAIVNMPIYRQLFDFLCLASIAISRIIENQQIWFTSHRYLNDSSELRFGIDAAAVTREAEEEMEQMTRFAGLETTGLKLGDVASCDTFQSARF